SPGQSTISTGDLLSTFPDSCPGLSTLQRWHTEFDKGVFAREKKTRPGQGNVARVKRLVDDNPRMTTRRFLSLKQDKIQLKDCLLMWDNARPHTATDTREFLTRRDVEQNLCDRFLFWKLKHLLREDEFGGHEEATLAVQWAMRRVSEDELYDQLRKLRGHCHDVIAVGGDYVY
ncbi:Uncharacterized protein FKW44_004693, partial [Caligus rogercresseyi]